MCRSCDIFVFILTSYQYPIIYTLTIPYSAFALVPLSCSPVPFTSSHSSATTTRPLFPSSSFPATTKKKYQKLTSFIFILNMGATASSMPAEPILAAAAVVGALGYGYVHYVQPVQHSDNTDDHVDANVSNTSAAVASSLHGQKKRGRKLQLPGDATLKNLDILDAPPVHASRSASASSAAGTRQRQRQQQQQLTQPQWEAPVAQPQDVLPGGFDGEVQSTDDARHVSQQQQQLTSAAPKKLKKKKGKKAAAANPSGPSSTSGAGSSPLASSTLTEGATAAAAAPVGKGKKVSVSASAVADTHDERWTRVEARKKKAPVPTQDDAGAGVALADVTTSDAGITTSATGNSSPVTERTTEDELPSELDECVFFCFFWCVVYLIACICARVVIS
jgi:hypothetical protein